MEILTHISQVYGTGNLAIDCMIVAIVMSFLLLSVVVLVSNRSKDRGSGRYEQDGFDRLSGVMGRLEKIEMGMNGFKTEALRSIEIFKGDVTQIKQELRLIKRSIATGPGEPPSGGGGPGTEIYRNDSEVLQSSAISELAEQISSGSLESDSLEEQIVLTKPLALAQPSLATRIVKTRSGFFQRLKNIFVSGANISPEMLDQLEEQLIGSDLGVHTTQALLEEVKQDLASGREVNETALKSILKIKILKILEKDAPFNSQIQPRRREDGPLVIMVVGVNGVGKTTSCAKLAQSFKSQGALTLLVAADTFRAAAVDQLAEWSKKIGVEMVSGPADSKPSSVVFDGMQRAMNENFDVVIIDTAGRLHNKANLMQELEGVRNIIKRHQPSAPHETILVLDGVTGLNAISQAREFHAAVALTGLIITKLDGTPKGGAVVGIKDELNVPVRYIGVGEGAEDLRPFVARDFVEALFDESGLESASSDNLSATLRLGEGAEANW